MKQYIWGRRLAFLFLLISLTLLAGCGGQLPAVSWFGIAVSDEAAYLSANEQVIAINLESGAELWAFPAEPERTTGPFYATPLVVDEQVVVGGFGDGKLYALAGETGEQEWVVETKGSIVGGAALADGGFAIGNGQGEVYLVDRETREKQLLLKADEHIWSEPLIDQAQGHAYVAVMDHRLYALDLENGERLWEFKAGGALPGAPALDEGVLYFGGLNSVFYAVDAQTAKELWRFETEGWVWGSPLVHEDTVYFGDMSGRMYALDKSSGNERWAPFKTEGGVRVSPLLREGVLYFGTQAKKFYAIRAEDGVQQWSVSLDGSVYSQPVIYGDYLLVSPHNAKTKLLALDPDSGAERWTYPRQEE